MTNPNDIRRRAAQGAAQPITWLDIISTWATGIAGLIAGAAQLHMGTFLLGGTGNLTTLAPDDTRAAQEGVLRVQWKRTPGWRAARDLPAGYIYVGRGTGPRGRWGNPFPEKEYGLDEAIRLHREWILADPARVAAVRAELKGRPLACWCRLDQPCHADTLIAIANGDVA
jgi:hypothetical protein